MQGEKLGMISKHDIQMYTWVTLLRRQVSFDYKHR